MLAGAHDPSRFEDLPVGEVVAVPFEVLGQVVGGLGDPRPDDEREPGVLQRVEVRRGQHSGVGDHDHVGHPVPGLERLQDRDEGAGLGLVPLEAVHLQREPGRVDQQPDLDLRIDPAFLAHPDLAQVVLVLGLEVQRGAVVEHQRRPPRRRRRRMRQARLRQRVAVVPLDAPLNAAVRCSGRRQHPDLVQHPMRQPSRSAR